MEKLKIFLLIAVVFTCNQIAQANADPWSTGANLAIPGQSKQPLTRNQIEQAIRNPIRDETIATEIDERGVDFPVTEDTLEALKKLGAGPRTIRALIQSCSPDSSKYGFEEKEGISWLAQTASDTKAVTAIEQSEKRRAKFGCYSLKLTVDLAAKHPTKSKGEAYVNLPRISSSGAKAGIDLQDVEISSWVYVPIRVAGDRKRPNGLQVFVKDTNGKSQYGSWFDLLGSANKWVRVSLTPSPERPTGGHIDHGFDPTRIAVVGVKIGVGDNSRMAPYRGSIYVDGVNWKDKEQPCSDPSKYGFEGSISWINRVNSRADQAITAVRQSRSGMAKYGCYSLELTVDLIGGHESKSKGEAYVELLKHPPSGMSAPIKPIDMMQAEITIWVYLPEGAEGDPNSPNGAQVFVKSYTERDRYKGKYGDWLNLPNSAGWIEVKLKPGEKEGGGFEEKGFDPTQIVEVGIKIGAGGDSKTPFKGSIYIDGIKW